MRSRPQCAVASPRAAVNANRACRRRRSNPSPRPASRHGAHDAQHDRASPRRAQPHDPADRRGAKKAMLRCRWQNWRWRRAERATARSNAARASSSITGPTSVAGSSGSPISSVSAAPCSMRSTRSAMSSCRQSSRSAEQRWPAEPNALVSTSVTTCSARAELSTIIVLIPPVSAMNGKSDRAARQGIARWPAPSRCRQ